MYTATDGPAEIDIGQSARNLLRISEFSPGSSFAPTLLPRLSPVWRRKSDGAFFWRLRDCEGPKEGEV